MQLLTHLFQSTFFESIFFFLFILPGHTENLQDAFNNQSADSVSDIGFALYGSLYSFAGWNALSYITAEMANPARDYPLAILIGIPLVIVCYILVNVAYLTVKSPMGIVLSSAIAVVCTIFFYRINDFYLYSIFYLLDNDKV